MTGLTETKAKSKITSDDLKVGTIKRKSSDTIKTGYIISATPQAEHKVAKNTKVNLVVSTGQQKVKMGNYVGDQYTQVAKRLRLKGITVKKKYLRVRMMLIAARSCLRVLRLVKE